VGVVEEPVDGAGGQGLGHDGVEDGGVQVAGDRDRATFECASLKWPQLGLLSS
jgi:hypothetical protein